jgi:large subunit ribosomal protein L21
MFAVVRVKGMQFRVEPDALVQVPKLTAEVGAEVPIDEVMLVGGEDAVAVGAPLVPGAKVLAEVVRHGRGPKITGIKYKRRKDYRRRWGARADFTELRIRSIQTN